MVRLLTFTCLLVFAFSLSAFKLVDESIGEAMKLAVQCKIEEALAIIAKAEEKVGLTEKLAILEHEAILREAGRSDDADEVKAKREESRPEMTEDQKEESEQAILQTVDNIRNERKKQTGSATCP